MKLGQNVYFGVYFPLVLNFKQLSFWLQKYWCFRAPWFWTRILQQLCFGVIILLIYEWYLVMNFGEKVYLGV